MVLQLSVAEVVPDGAAVLAALDVPADQGGRPHLEALVGAAFAAFEEAAAPVGMVADLSRDEFAGVYAGAGGNAPDSVVADIFPRAEAISLFVVTLGPGVGDAIARRFAERDYALAAALDAVASEAADRAAEVVERRVEESLRDQGRLGHDGAALRYSPGYCGWHVSGQAALFRHLGPGRIGVQLTEAGFMVPEKSVSGVILAGPREIHPFTPSYPFCAACATRACLARVRTLLGQEARAVGGSRS
ncbi:MAG TPA: vitamin B12 dependent-methionine synthase activation domain-containing protein [Longimicrobiales bacterium]|nr:vitamin B12 dependent-methionine synthase activation domain-containing protein [Longimicrobiales bacterium]